MGRVGSVGGIRCPKCRVHGDVLSTTTPWKYYCPDCDIRHDENGVIVPLRRPVPNLPILQYRCPECKVLDKLQVRGWMDKKGGIAEAVSIFCEACGYLGILEFKNAVELDVEG